MKRLFAVLLTFALCLGLAACAAGGADEPGKPDAGISAPAEPTPVSQPVQPVQEPESEPEPGYALRISEQPIPTVEGCAVTDRIPAHLINNTGEDASVLLIPYLEKLDENGQWTEVPWKEGIGFCGTPDRLPPEGKDWYWEISTLWGSLEDGQYRIGVKCQPYLDSEETVYGEFTLYTPENNAGLPLAGQE